MSVSCMSVCVLVRMYDACVYAGICVCRFVCVHVCICKSMCMCVFLSVCLPLLIFTNVCVCVYAYVCISACCRYVLQAGGRRYGTCVRCLSVYPPHACVCGGNLARRSRAGRCRTKASRVCVCGRYVTQPGGSVQDQGVTDACNQYNLVQSHHGMRLFHH